MDSKAWKKLAELISKALDFFFFIWQLLCSVEIDREGIRAKTFSAQAKFDEQWAVPSQPFRFEEIPENSKLKLCEPRKLEAAQLKSLRYLINSCVPPEKADYLLEVCEGRLGYPLDLSLTLPLPKPYLTKQNNTQEQLTNLDDPEVPIKIENGILQVKTKSGWLSIGARQASELFPVAYERWSVRHKKHANELEKGDAIILETAQTFKKRKFQA